MIAIFAPMFPWGKYQKPHSASPVPFAPPMKPTLSRTGSAYTPIAIEVSDPHPTSSYQPAQALQIR